MCATIVGLDMDEAQRLIEEAKKQTSLVLFSNITHDAKDLEGWATLAKAMENAGADLIEANLICPNITLTAKQLAASSGGEKGEEGGAIAGQDPEAAGSIARALKESVGIPVVCKLTPNVTDITAVAAACEAGGADARLPGRSPALAAAGGRLPARLHLSSVAGGKHGQPWRPRFAAHGLRRRGPDGPPHPGPAHRRRRAADLGAWHPVHDVGSRPW